MDTPSGWVEWCELCRHTDSVAQFNELMSLFLTDDERAAIAGRYRIIQALLSKSESQRQIADSQNVSIAKITRGSNSLKHVSEDLNTFLTQQCKTITK